MKKGKLIVIEGACDGIGKSTQFDMLKDRLAKEYKIVTHHFPSYGTKQASDVEKYLNGEYGDIDSLDPYFINKIYAYDRKVTWDEELKDKYNDNYIILLDRYTTSSIIYQSCLMNKEDKIKFIDDVYKYEFEELKIAKPDKVIFLTAPYDLIKEFRSKRNNKLKEDIHESNNNFLKKVYDNASFIANYLGWDIVNCSNENNDNFRGIKDINDEIYKIIKKM